MMVMNLSPRLPPQYAPAPGFTDVPYRDYTETDDDGADLPHFAPNWTPGPPAVEVVSDLLELPVYEMRVYDTTRGRRLVAVVELVSPAHKDRIESRRVFAARCVAFLQKQISVAIVDIVSIHSGNIYESILNYVGHTDPSLAAGTPSMYAAALRVSKRDKWMLETWVYPLGLGQPLPTLPLWLADNLALPLDLEASYEECCRTLRMV